MKLVTSVNQDIPISHPCLQRIFDRAMIEARRSAMMEFAEKESRVFENKGKRANEGYLVESVRDVIEECLNRVLEIIV